MTTIYTRASKGSALTWAEGDANVTNLNNAKLENVAEDLTPQLGGNLDVNGNSIVSASNGNIAITPNGTGSVVIDGNTFPQTQGAIGEVLTADGSGLVEWKQPGAITAQVYNADSVTINKGEPVYVFGAQGSNISVKRALNTGDATSAQTLGLANENITAGSTGIVICQGVLRNVDTSAYTAGQALYLGATAGSKTTTKPYAPNHLVYLGFVESVNAVSGRIYVRTQNGYELDEIHDVQITTTPSNGQVLAYESSSSLWRPTTLTDNNTTYSISAETATGGVNLRLTGSDSSTDNVKLAAGSNITLTRTDADTITIAATDTTGMTSFTVAGDSGSSQTIENANTLTISGGTGLSSVASATDTITINLDNTAVTPNTYALATVTVDQQGRITSASAASTTGSGNVVLATSPTLTTPILGTPTSGNLSNCTVDGTNPIGYRDLPAVGSQSGSYSLTTSDVGKYVEVASGGSITVPNSTFSAGDVVVIVNNHSAAITITCSITDAYIAGTDTDKATVSLATRGIANIFFVSGTRCIITGNVS